MGNACGCADGTKKDGDQGNLRSPNKANDRSYPAYKLQDFNSKITPSEFASIPDKEKDALLAEAFKLLVTTVEPHKINSMNTHIKQLTSKTVGKVINTNGDIYEGELIDGVANGKGTINYRDGVVYEGQMFNGVCHGTGKVKTPNSKYTGSFYNGFPVGFVSQTFTAALPEDSGILEGAFDTKGKEAGPFLMKFSNGDSAYYIQKESKMDGPYIFIPKDRSYVVLSEYKGDQESKPAVVYKISQPAGKK